MKYYPFEEKYFLGKRLRELRLAFGFKQEDIAKTLNVSRSTYSYYETGTTRPDPAVLGKLASYYHIPVSAFFEEGENPAEAVLGDSAVGRHRTSRSSSEDPYNVAELEPVERSLILLLRSNGYVTAAELLSALEFQIANRRAMEGKDE